MNYLKTVIWAMALAVSCAAQAQSDTYRCFRSHHSDDLIMTLGPDYVIIRGRRVPAKMEWLGLTQVWFVGDDRNYQVHLSADDVAGYYDFTGAGPKETRKAEFIVYCR